MKKKKKKKRICSIFKEAYAKNLFDVRLDAFFLRVWNSAQQLCHWKATNSNVHQTDMPLVLFLVFHSPHFGFFFFFYVGVDSTKSGLKKIPLCLWTTSSLLSHTFVFPFYHFFLVNLIWGVFLSFFLFNFS